MFTTKRNNVLADGGMMQEGGAIDETSGNKVPVGSTKEEVRDDIDAKLSVGEYVFPADVTRYYGIAKLEEMRKEAQEGLKQMESGGRMGNAEQVSEEASNEYDDAEFSKEVDEDMASYDNEQKYANGGVVTYDPVASQETYKRAPLKGFEMIPMSDDKGNTIYIPFINGKPQLNIPPGFAIRAAAPKVEAPAADSTTPTAPAAEQRGGGSDRANQGGGGLGYSPTSGLTSPGAVSFQGAVQQGLDAYGNVLGGMMPYGAAAKLAAKAMLPSATLAESAKEQSILAANKASFGPSYAGAGYGTSVADGGFGITSATGAGIAANPMGIDPATAQGQQAIVNQAVQLSLDQGIDPNDALSRILGESDFSAAISGQDAANARDSIDTGVTVGPAISTPNTSPTTLGPATGDSGGSSQRGGESVGGYGAGSQAGAAAASGTVGGMGPGTPGFNGGGGRNGGGDGGGGGAATGGQGGDASGGGDRGTRGGFAKGGLVSKRNK